MRYGTKTEVLIKRFALAKAAPCVCGAQACLELVEKRLILDRIGLDVKNFAQYRCSTCGEVWYPVKALSVLRQGCVVQIIGRKELSPTRLRFIRKTMGLSQEAFAQAVGLRGGKAIFSRYESSERIPGPAIVQAIGLFVEKWVRDEWKLVPVEPIGFDPFDYRGRKTERRLHLDLNTPGFSQDQAQS